MSSFYEKLRDFVKEGTQKISENIKYQKSLEERRKRILVDSNRVHAVIDYHMEYGDSMYVKLDNGNMALAPKIDIMGKKIKNRGPYRAGRVITGYVERHPKNQEGASDGKYFDKLYSIYHTR